MKKLSIALATLLLLCIALSGCSKNRIKKADVGGTISLKVTCQSATEYDDKELSVELPKDGIYYEKEKIKFAKEDSIQDVINRELSKKKIDVEFTEYNTIRSIGGLSSKDCGNESGWACYVNGKYIAFSYDSVKVNDGDKIEIAYYTSYLEMMKKR